MLQYHSRNSRHPFPSVNDRTHVEGISRSRLSPHNFFFYSLPPLRIDPAVFLVLPPPPRPPLTVLLLPHSKASASYTIHLGGV